MDKVNFSHYFITSAVENDKQWWYRFVSLSRVTQS